MIDYYKTTIPFPSVKGNEYTTYKFNKREDGFILLWNLTNLVKDSMVKYSFNCTFTSVLFL